MEQLHIYIDENGIFQSFEPPTSEELEDIKSKKLRVLTISKYWPYVCGLDSHGKEFTISDNL